MKARTLAMTPLAVSLIMAMTACNDTETEYVYAPTITVAQAVVTVPDEGGTATASYTISNPVEGGEITASASAAWLSDIDASAGGTVTFAVSANNNADPRTSRITITYTYTLAGSRGTVTADVTVAQSCGDQPVISVSPTAVTAAVEGGSYSFSYTIVNPVDDGEVSATTSASWLSGLTASNGTVTFTAAANGGGLRTSKIDLAYSYSGRAVYESVTVVQSHNPGVEGIDPADFAGTYTCTGSVYNSNYNGDNNYSTQDSWTMKIYYLGDDDLLISGLVPDTVDYYPYEDGTGYTYENGPYTAYAKISGDDILVSHPQWTGWSTTIYGGKYYICWVGCPEEGYYSLYGGTLKFKYNSSTETWTSDYGLWLGLLTSEDTVSEDTFYSYYDFFLPGMSFTKTSASTASTGVAPLSLRGLEEREFHTGAKPYRE